MTNLLPEHRQDPRGGRGGTPRERARESESRAGLAIITDHTASAGDRLRAMEQLESRALGADDG
jgi:hypothetical protein